MFETWVLLWYPFKRVWVPFLMEPMKRYHKWIGHPRRWGPSRCMCLNDSLINTLCRIASLTVFHFFFYFNLLLWIVFSLWHSLVWRDPFIFFHKCFFFSFRDPFIFLRNGSSTVPSLHRSFVQVQVPFMLLTLVSKNPTFTFFLQAYCC